jgi:essential protein Yae1
MDRKPSARKTKVGPKLVVKCSCGAPLGNPLTHRCVTHTDFRKRKREAEKPAPRPKPAGNAHEYAACEDDDCPRFQCRVYKEGRSDGIAEGRQLGYDEGYAIGFPEGMAACPLPHQG